MLQFHKEQDQQERDPNGMEAHTPGAKLDEGKVRIDLIFDGFPNALKAVAEVATFGAQKYSENGWQMVPNGVKRYTAAMDRHRIEEGVGHDFDSETGYRHAAHLAWNALARLELMIREDIYEDPYDAESAQA